MIEDFLSNWNSLYKTHKASIVEGSAKVHEYDEGAHFTDLDIIVGKAITFPSREFDSFSLFDAISNKNCDGAFLIEREENLFDLVLIELKSSFDTKRLFDAKEQIISSLPKINVLLSVLKDHPDLTIRKSYGIIVSLSPTDEQLNWIKGKSMLPKSQWESCTCGLTLYLDRCMKVKTLELPMNQQYLPTNFEVYYYDSPESHLTIEELPV